MMFKPPLQLKESQSHLPHSLMIDAIVAAVVSPDRKSGCLFRADSSKEAFASRLDYRGELTGLHQHNNGERESAAVRHWHS